MTSEADTRANYIDPALSSSGWQSSQVVREYYFTDGRKLAGGQRGTRCFVDYLLHSSNRHLAIIEAKRQSAHPTQGLQQALGYAKKLGVRFVYSTNGSRSTSLIWRPARAIMSRATQPRLNCWPAMQATPPTWAGNCGISPFILKRECALATTRSLQCMLQRMPSAAASSGCC